MVIIFIVLALAIVGACWWFFNEAKRLGQAITEAFRALRSVGGVNHLGFRLNDPDRHSAPPKEGA